MPLITVAFGLVLILTSVVTFIAAEDPGIGALLPALLGLVILGCGVASIIKKHLRMHMMHVAVLLAFLALAIPMYGIIKVTIEALEGDEGLAHIRIFITALASALYLYAAVQSFITARRNRKEEKAIVQADPPGDE